MAYFQVLETPITGQAFLATDRDVVGFEANRMGYAKERVSVEDVFLCRMTGLARWFSALEITSEVYECKSPICGRNGLPLFTRKRDSCEPAHDLYTVRFKVKERVVIDDFEYAVPYREIPVSVSPQSNFCTVCDSDGERLEKRLKKRLEDQQANQDGCPLSDEARRILARARSCAT